MSLVTSILAIFFALSGSYPQDESPVTDKNFCGETDIIRIGFLVESDADRTAIHGASLAVREANKNRKATEPAFEIVVRSMEGPWGTGSKQTVNLIFDDNVAAIAGSFLGRNAHLAEQVCAKSKIPLVSARATDQTLTQAFVPWYFCVVPSDDSQAESLYRELNRSKTGTTLIICDDSYDARQAMKSYMRIHKSKGNELPEIIDIEQANPDMSGIGKAISGSKRPILLFSTPPLAGSLMSKIRERNQNSRVFTTLAALDEDMKGRENYSLFEGITVISPEYWSSDSGKGFSSRFRQEYGYDPGVKAAYAYDAVNLLTRAISIAGTESGAIQQALYSASFDCVTGQIRFDEHGNRIGLPSLARIINGKFALH